MIYLLRVMNFEFGRTESFEFAFVRPGTARQTVLASAIGHDPSIMSMSSIQSIKRGTSC